MAALRRAGLPPRAAAAVRAHLLVPGKRLRPRLFLAGLEVFGARPRPEHAAVACALELFHAFLLIHDDLVDRADTRRGEPVLPARLASSGHFPARLADATALVLGDLLFGRCLGLLHAVRLPAGRRRALLACFDAVVAETGAGQALEFDVGTRELRSTTVALVRRVAVLKTSRYTFEAPLACAALVAGRAGAVPALRPVTDPLGIGFQMLNDLHEVRRMEAGLAADDFLAGVRTEAMVRLHRSLPPGDAERLAAALDRGGAGLEPGELAAWLRRAGIGDRLAREARGCIARAHRRLATAELRTRERAGLAALFRSLEDQLAHSEAATNRAGSARGGS